jgi:hypothetical protein
MLEVGDCVAVATTAGFPPPLKSSAAMLEVGDSLKSSAATWPLEVGDCVAVATTAGC